MSLIFAGISLNMKEHTQLQGKKIGFAVTSVHTNCLQTHGVFPCSLATEVERMERLRFRNVRADSQSRIIFVIEDGSSVVVDSDPTDIAAYESRTLRKFPKNCICQSQSVRNYVTELFLWKT